MNQSLGLFFRRWITSALQWLLVGVQYSGVDYFVITYSEYFRKGTQRMFETLQSCTKLL